MNSIAHDGTATGPAARPIQLMVMPGDGIGQEVTAEALRVLEWFIARRDLAVNLRHIRFGAEAYHATGQFITEEDYADLVQADAVLFGAFGGTLEANPIPPDIRRRFGLLRIRRDMELFANVRPVRCLPSLVDASPLRPEICTGVDLVVVRELIGGIYFGEPRGIESLPNGERRGFNTQSYSTSEVERVGNFAFGLARGRRKALMSVDKSNVLESSTVWRDTMRALGAAHPDVALDHLYVDACAAELIVRPRRFDVIVTDNMFGDILSDAAACIAGSLGMLPSASLGPECRPGVARAFYEPVHGSAPDIAGKGIANPCGAILSVGMALEHTFGRAADAALLQAAVDAALLQGRTVDLAHGTVPTVGTRAFGALVLEALEALDRS